MVEQTSFKIRVKEITITESKKYKEVFVTHQYLIRSKDFKKKLLYSCSKKDNFLHLSGINVNLSTASFLINAMMEHLLDFNFHKKGKYENSIKGSVRKKIKSLKRVNTLFQEDILIEEDFKKIKLYMPLPPRIKRLHLDSKYFFNLLITIITNVLKTSKYD